MERWRDKGRAEERSELGFMPWIRVFRVGFRDLRLCLVAEARKSWAEAWREERSRFSI